MSDVEHERVRERDDEPPVAPPAAPRGPDSGASSLSGQAPLPGRDDAPTDDLSGQSERRLQTSDLLQSSDRDEATPSAAGTAGAGEEPLLADSQSYLGRWQEIQAAFVDEPRRAVQDADSLVAEVMQRLAESFSSERGRLEQQWSGGQEAGTEELRLALQRYRSFFNRLLST